MSQFIQLFKNMAPGSPATIKREGRFKKHNRNSTRSISGMESSSSNLLRKKSMSTSALHQLREDSDQDTFVSDVGSNQRRNSNSSIPTDNTNESELKSPLTVRELIERMITHLQILERKNEILTQTVKDLTEEKRLAETELSSSKVELNLYQNRLRQLEETVNEWHCSICMDNKETIVNSKRLIVATFCGHVFCSSCAQSLISPTRQSKYCPTCRKPFKDGQPTYHPIFI